MNPSSQRPLRLALIGMSGAGKTFWSRLLASAGHPAVSCDDKIEERLASRLAAGGYAELTSAAWMAGRIRRLTLSGNRNI